MAHSSPVSHRPSVSHFFKEKILPKLAMMVVGVPDQGFGSIDLTNRCNLRCKHCYFYEQDVPEEFDDEAWKAKFQELSSGPKKLWAMTWVGGEPLLRKDLIAYGKQFFRHNLVVTNGLITLPDWEEVHFHISLDGDEQAHESMRNQKGIYKQIMKNADRPELQVVMAYCVSSLNADCIENVLEEWKDVGIKGFLFSFYTPIESIKDPLFPGWERRDQIIDRLIELKKTTYGSFIQNDVRTLELMKSGESKKVTDNCMFMKKGFSLDPVGHRKSKCMMGDKADCDRCGCIVPFHLHRKTEKKTIVKDLLNDTRTYWSQKDDQKNHSTVGQA
ncbi:MAG: radical SAM protein [Bdellovibrionota bacterium]